MKRRASIILAVMALAPLLWAEPGQAGAPAAGAPAEESAPNQMKQFLQQQIAQERQKQRQKRAAKKRIPIKKPQTLVKKPQAKKQQVKKPFYRVLLIAGWRKKLRADLITPDQEIIRVKTGDRLNAHLGASPPPPPPPPRSFIVKAITDKSVKLSRDGRTFLLRMASQKDMRWRTHAPPPPPPPPRARTPVSATR